MQHQFDEKENSLNSQETRPNFWQALEHNQKIALIVLAVFVLFLMVVWSIQFGRSLSEPFAYKGEDSQIVTPENATATDVELKNKDTDGDSLSDWDELNNYKTSPYLEDSDSDGIKDAVEIQAGTDPNCPEGKNCIVEESVDTDSQATDTPTLAPAEVLDVSKASTSQADLQGLLQGGSDAATLRKMLLDSGMDEKVLNQISDQDLIDSYRNLQKN